MESSDTVLAISKALRSLKNLKKFCESHDLPYSYAAMIKNGERQNLGHETVVKFCAALGLDPSTGLPIGQKPTEAPRRTFSVPVRRDPNRPVMFSEESLEIPPNFELYEEELRMILARRDLDDPYHVFHILKEEAQLGRVYLPEGDTFARATLKSILARIDDFLSTRELQNEAAKQRKK